MAFIYIADDDELLCDLVKGTLRTWGHTVGSVENGDDIITALPIKKPDLLILDCNMPGQSGIMVLRALRSTMQFYGKYVLNYAELPCYTIRDRPVF